MKKKLSQIIIPALVLAAQPFMLVSIAMAQGYGEGSYSGGVYNDSIVDEGGSQPSNPPGPGETPRPPTSTGGTPSQISDPDAMPVDDSEEQPDSVTGDDNDRDDTTEEITGTPTGSESSDSSSDSGNFMRWASLSALGGALLLITVALIAKKRRQE